MRVAVALLLTLVAASAHAQSNSAQTSSAPTRTSFTCGTFKAESWKSGATTYWTIARGAEKNTESGALKRGPRFVCIGDAALIVEFVPSNGQAFLDLNFPDGTNIGYGGQHLEKNGRFVLPVQARQRIPAPFRAAFDYHCRFELPADPITPEARAFCS